MLKDLDFADDTPQLSLTMIQIRNMEAHQDREKEDKHLSNQMPQKNSRNQWQQHILNETLKEIKEAENVSGEVRRRRLNWIGHVLKKDSTDDCALALGWAPKGKRKRGCPKKQHGGGW